MYFRIAEIVSPESSKKTTESVKLPPTKQNGHLVQSDEPQETKKSKKAENHDGRQIADPKRKKKSNFFIISFIHKTELLNIQSSYEDLRVKIMCTIAKNQNTFINFLSCFVKLLCCF